MKTDGKRLFQALEPPAGGAERLLARLARPAATTRMRPLWALVTASVAAVALIFAIGRVDEDIADADVTQTASLYGSPALDRLLGRQSEPYALRVTVDGREAEVAELASADPKIRIYNVE